MADCVALAKDVAADVAARHTLPVFLYEEAAASPARRNLEDIRRGEFEGLAAKLQQPAGRQISGPTCRIPSAGASVVGARMPLIAYNINLATNRLDVAKKIAAAIRHSSGGFRFVKAMGLELADRGIVQVSMNLTNFEKTPIFRVFELVKREAARYGVVDSRKRNRRPRAVRGAHCVGRVVPAARRVQRRAGTASTRLRNSLQSNERFAISQIPRIVDCRCVAIADPDYHADC